MRAVIYDLADPMNPVRVSEVGHADEGFDLVYHTMAAVTFEVAGTLYAALAGSQGVQIMDLTDVTAPVAVPPGPWDLYADLPSNRIIPPLSYQHDGGWSSLHCSCASCDRVNNPRHR